MYMYHHNMTSTDGKCIMHTCDNRKCININHLKLGTQAENNKDRANKGRSAITKGENHPSNKLSEKDVLFIRSQKGKISGMKLAEQFNMHYSTIYYIWKNKLWAHI